MNHKFGRFSDPRDPKRPERISLAYGEWSEVPRKIISKYGDSVTELDLSHNKFFSFSLRSGQVMNCLFLNISPVFSDLKSLQGFTKLNTVVLDHNSLSARSTFPPLDSLKILWVNHNQITNLSLFIETISQCYPNLTYLSMINNKAAPSYFNGGTYISYKDYRQFVISSLDKLRILDGVVISEKERKEALKVYGKRRKNTSKRYKI